MSELNDFLKLIAEGKKTDPAAIKAKEIKENIKGDLGNLFSEMSRIKEQDPVTIRAKEQRQHIQEVVKEDLGSLFSQLAELKNKKKELEQQVPVVEEVLVERIYTEPPTEPVPASQVHSTSELDKYLTNKSFQQPNPDKVPPELKAVTDKIKFLEQAIGRIAATGPGGGEVNLRYLDDVDRSTIANGLYLRYNSTKKKFEFADPADADNDSGYATITYVDSLKDRIVSPNNAHATIIDNTGTTTSGGNIVPGTNTDTLGTITNPWKDIFISQGSIYIADQDPESDAVSLSNTAKYIVISEGGLKVTDNSGDFEIFQLDNTGKLILKSTQPLNTTTPALSLVGNLSGNQLGTNNSGVMLQVTGTQDNPSRIYIDGVGSNAYAAFVGRHARGTSVTPTQTLDGDIIARFGGNAYASGVGLNTTSNVRVDMVATENQTSTNRGTRLEFWTTPIGSAVPQRSAHLDSAGIDFTEATDTNAGVTFKDGSLLKYWPSITGNTGKILRTDGNTFFWASETVPSGQVLFKGEWNASTNSPSVSNATGTTGWQYIVSVAGTQNLGNGSVAYTVGDQIIHDGTKYIRIPAQTSQVQSNWTESNSALASYIQNKPTLATVATSGSYLDLSNRPIIPAAQVNSDWNATSGVSQILNKPTIPTQGITSIVPTALDSTHHVAATTVGTVATLICDATTDNTPNTIVLRDNNGNINVASWSVNTHLTAVDYAVTATDYWIGVTAKTRTITLPATAPQGRQYYIADCVHSGNTRIDIAATSPATAIGNTVITQQGQTVTATFISGVWYCN